MALPVLSTLLGKFDMLHAQDMRQYHHSSPGPGVGGNYISNAAELLMCMTKSWRISYDQ